MIKLNLHNAASVHSNGYKLIVITDDIDNLNTFHLLHNWWEIATSKLAAAELIKIHHAVITQQVLIAIFNKIKK